MDNVFWLIRIGFRTTGILILLGMVIIVISLMLPVKVWRTGELPTEPLQLHPAKPFAISPLRVWIDTDAACGQDRRTDPDDCFAILLLTQQKAVEVVGVSTVFGNAPLADTDRITRALMATIAGDRPSISVYRGASTAPITQGISHAATAHEAVVRLRSALEQ